MDPRVRHLYGKLNELSTIDGLAVPRVSTIRDVRFVVCAMRALSMLIWFSLT